MELTISKSFPFQGCISLLLFLGSLSQALSSNFSGFFSYELSVLVSAVWVWSKIKSLSKLRANLSNLTKVCQVKVFWSISIESSQNLTGILILCINPSEKSKRNTPYSVYYLIINFGKSFKITVLESNLHRFYRLKFDLPLTSRSLDQFWSRFSLASPSLLQVGT